MSATRVVRFVLPLLAALLLSGLVHSGCSDSSDDKPMFISNLRLTPAFLNVPYSGGQITVAGEFLAPVKFTAAGALPPGITLDSTTGVFIGTPTAQGRYPFQAQAEDAAGQRAIAQLELVVN